MTDQETLKHKDLDGRAIAASIHEELKPEIAQLTEGDWPPRLVSVTIGDVEAVEIYVRNQKRTAERLGISRVTLWRKMKDLGIERPD